MANVTTLDYDDLIALYPEFVEGPGKVGRRAQIDLFIQVAGREVNVAFFGDQADFAVLTLGAHFISMADRNNESHLGGAGPITGKTTGESIISFGSVNAGDGYDGYRTTSYGSLYVQIMLALGGSPLGAS